MLFIFTVTALCLARPSVYSRKKDKILFKYTMTWLLKSEGSIISELLIESLKMFIMFIHSNVQKVCIATSLS